MRFLAAAVLLLAACASIPTQTAYMKEQGVKVSSDALRARLRAEATPFTGRMALAADEAAAATTDPAQRRRALVWKINVVPALYRTLFAQRPMVALLDTWALLLQAEAYLDSPAGRADFGPGSATVLATTRELEGRVQDVAAWAFPARDLGVARARLSEWAGKHPVVLTFATRDSIEPDLVKMAPEEELSAFALAGRIDEDIGGIVDRLDFLPVMVPHQATWQAQLAYVDLVDPRLDMALSRGSDALRKIDDMLVWLGTSGLDGFAEEQRVQLVRALSAERAEVERLVDRQRTQVEAFVERERLEVQALIARERAAAMDDARKLADHAAAEASRHAREVVDHALLRAGALLAGLLVLGAVLAYVVRRGKSDSARVS